MRWRITGELPTYKKQILIAAPHTSNWDCVIMLLCAWYYKISVKFLGKKEIFSTPLLGRLMYKLGGIPIERNKRNNYVERLVKDINDYERIILCIPPEGTRSKQKTWKTGFYYIAKTANIPITCSFIDYAKKQAGIGPVIFPSDDKDKDFEIIKTFYKDIKGKHPQNQTHLE